jgi:hypothetical protein
VSFFELLFYIFAILSIPILISIIRQFARRRRRSAWKTLRVYLVLVAIYAAVLVATLLATPIRALPPSEPQYLGDWSISVTSVRRFPHRVDETYELDFRLSNRGNKVLKGPKWLDVYLLRQDGARYDPYSDPSEPPFDTAISPGKSVTTTRKFILPTNLNRVELVMVRKGLRLGWFLIGRTPFDGHTVVVLQ